MGYKSLLSHHKETLPWHFDPSIESQDCTFVGNIDMDWDRRIQDLKNLDCLSKTSCVDIWPEDRDNWEQSEIAWSKRDHIENGYVHENTRHDQIVSSDLTLFPDWVSSLISVCKLNEVFVGIVRQPCGSVIPWHSDSYEAFKRKFELEEQEMRNIVRYLVFPEGWRWGHFVQIGNNVLSNWKAGDIYTWPNRMHHLTCNAGIQPKYTIQITGFVSNDSLHLRAPISMKLD